MVHVSLLLRCSEQIRGRIYLSRGKISKVGHWLNYSVVSRIARGPGFEFRSGHDFFFPCDIQIKLKWHLLLFYPSTWYICDFFLFHIEIEGKGWVDYWGGGGKGYVAPLSNYWGGLPPTHPRPPSSYAYDSPIVHMIRSLDSQAKIIRTVGYVCCTMFMSRVRPRGENLRHDHIIMFQKKTISDQAIK